MSFSCTEIKGDVYQYSSLGCLRDIFLSKILLRVAGSEYVLSRGGAEALQVQLRESERARPSDSVNNYFYNWDDVRPWLVEWDDLITSHQYSGFEERFEFPEIYDELYKQCLILKEMRTDLWSCEDNLCLNDELLRFQNFLYQFNYSWQPPSSQEEALLQYAQTARYWAFSDVFSRRPWALTNYPLWPRRSGDPNETPTTNAPRNKDKYYAYQLYCRRIRSAFKVFPNIIKDPFTWRYALVFRRRTLQNTIALASQGAKAWSPSNEPVEFEIRDIHHSLQTYPAFIRRGLVLPATSPEHLLYYDDVSGFILRIDGESVHIRRPFTLQDYYRQKRQESSIPSRDRQSPDLL